MNRNKMFYVVFNLVQAQTLDILDKRKIISVVEVVESMHFGAVLILFTLPFVSSCHILFINLGF